jgi:hypothetical protein
MVLPLFQFLQFPTRPVETNPNRPQSLCRAAMAGKKGRMGKKGVWLFNKQWEVIKSFKQGPGVVVHTSYLGYWEDHGLRPAQVKS